VIPERGGGLVTGGLGKPVHSAHGSPVSVETASGFGAAAGFQRWRSLLFVHWEAPPALLRALVPDPLEIDTFEGRAYVGLIPFDMPEVRPLRRLPRVPTAGRFLETNLRTYVRLRGRPGVWFFSLDAGSLLAVLGARATFGLPYFRADMTMTASGRGDQRHYVSRRTWPRPGPAPGNGRPASLDLHYEVGADIGRAAPGTLAHFLVERYTLFARHPLLGLLRGEVRHQPYPLRAARILRLEQTLTVAAHLPGLGEPSTPPLFSEGVDVEISPPRRPA
jgi:uncharacterized protein